LSKEKPKDDAARGTLAKQDGGKDQNSDLQRPDLVQFELNLEDAPLFASQARHLSRGAVEYVEQYTTEDGKKGEKKWRFKPPDEYGDLDIFDQDVYMAINALLQERGGMPADGKVSFTIYELVRILDLPENGQNYARVRESILRMGKTLIDAENAFYRKDKLNYESEHFIIWRVHFEANANLYGRASERHTLRFDEVLVRSHRSGYIKQLDVNYYLSLSGTHAKSLYRLIDHRRGDSLEWTIGVKRLKDLLGMAPSYRYPSKIKEKLQPAHEELVSKGFLKEVHHPERDILTYKVAESFVSARSQLERAWSTEENRAIRTLIRNEVWPHIAKKLVAEHGIEKCAFYVRALPYQKGIRQPGAWLKWAIDGDIEVAVPEDDQPKLPEPEDTGLASGESLGGTSDAGYDLFSGDRDDTAPNEPPAPDPEALTVWEKTLDTLADEINTPSFKVWFEGTVPVLVDGPVLSIVVPNSFAQDYISKRFKAQLEDALIPELGESATLRVLVTGEAAGEPISTETNSSTTDATGK
jgi:hypothetical protein